VKRREFITLVGGAAVWPLAARAQQRTKLPTIGFLTTGSSAIQSAWFAAFVQRLREIGWTEGQNARIERRVAEGRSERFAEIAAEFIAMKVNVIVTTGGAVPAVKQATSTIPIVFALANDPVGSGYVASLARPGGNITGVSAQSTDLVGKRLDLLREVVPSLTRLGVLGDGGNRSVSAETDELRTAGRPLGIDVTAIEIGRAEDVSRAFEALKGTIQAVYVVPTPLTVSNMVRINTLALASRLPALYGYRESVEAGGLMSYGPDFLDMWRRAAEYVDKILHGANPADIPVEQPTRFNLVLNLTTAKAVGLEIPPTLLARADDVIE
jgi:putative tryptophan/tyrosine transport system substrate-binding protein